MNQSNGETHDFSNSFDHVVTVAPERSKTDFFRSALLFLTELPTTPVDVTKATFGKVTEGVVEVVRCSAHVMLSYSASVGYDREEYYIAHEKRFVDGSYRMVEVEKKRTVTDWQPHRGEIEDNLETALFNGGLGSLSKYGDVWDFRLMQVLDTIEENSMSLDQESAKVAPQTINDAKSVCAQRLEQEIEYPGDHVKDKRVHPTVSLHGMTCYKIPYYEVEFEYEGEAYQVFGFAAGEPVIRGVVPIVKTSMKKQVTKAKIISGVTIAATYVVTALLALISSLVLLGFMYNSDLNCALSLMGLPVAIAELVFLKLYKSKVQKTLLNGAEKIAEEKATQLVSTLSDLGLEPLTQEESYALGQHLASHMTEDETIWYDPKPLLHTLLWIGLSIPYVCGIALFIGLFWGVCVGAGKLMKLMARPFEALTE